PVSLLQPPPAAVVARRIRVHSKSPPLLPGTPWTHSAKRPGAAHGFLFLAILGGVALLATSAMFGHLHLHGHPPGILGAGLTGLAGLAVGLLRRWSGGPGLTTMCHECADATTFGILTRP